MTVEKTLLRVEGDLAAGDLAKARQRLESLVVAFPVDLAVREALARVCRLQGEVVQAGRWSYLAAERDPVEVAAFEKAARDPVDRMRALKWPAEPDAAATPVARARLEALQADAQARLRSRRVSYPRMAERHWQPPRPLRERLGDAAGMTVVLVILGLFLVGVVDGLWTVLSWLR